MQYYQPFSRGARACIGQKYDELFEGVEEKTHMIYSLTIIEQKITLAAIVANFTPIEVSSHTIEWYEATTNAVPDSRVYVTLGSRD